MKHIIAVFLLAGSVACNPSGGRKLIGNEAGSAKKPKLASSLTPVDWKSIKYTPSIVSGKITLSSTDKTNVRSYDLRLTNISETQVVLELVQTSDKETYLYTVVPRSRYHDEYYINPQDDSKWKIYLGENIPNNFDNKMVHSISLLIDEDFTMVSIGLKTKHMDQTSNVTGVAELR